MLCIVFVLQFKLMTQVTESILFRQKLYQNFKQSGLLSKLKTTLRTNLLQKLQKPAIIPNEKQNEEEKTLPFHLKKKFLESIVAEYLQTKQYSLSIFMAECNLEEQDCLRYNQLSQIVNLGKPSNQKPFLFRLIEEFGNIRCMEARQRSTQTDFDEPLSKKLQIVQKQYKTKIDYWKLIPNTNIIKVPDSLYQQEQKLRLKFNIQKQQLKKQLERQLKQQIQKKYQNQYLFRMREVQKQHESRLSEMKTRQKTILDGLERKKKDLQEKSRAINEQQMKMINKYELRMQELQSLYKAKMKELQLKQKQFWKKQLQLKAKKRQYQQTIRLVKQKVISEANNT